MSALLTENLPLLAAAPGGIKKLRGLILELAVRGKLVPQNPEDEPASEQLKRIKAEKAQLVAEGTIKKDKPLPEIGEDEKPFALPQGWEWVRLGEISLQITDGTHHTPKYITSGVPFLSIKDISSGQIDFSDTKFISEEEHKTINRRCNPEMSDILLCRIGTLGRPVIVDTTRPFSVFVSVGLIKSPKSIKIHEWKKIALDSPFLSSQYNKIKAGGSHTNKLNLSDIPGLFIPLPPLAEQKLIVAKVDELMTLCDRLEAQQTDAGSAHAILVATLLDGLSRSQDAEDFTANWQRLNNHFDSLFTTEASLDALKQTLLQLAVMGKLVPQNPEDEPASELLKRIKAEKAQLVAEGKIKKDKPLPEIGEDEKPFTLPQGWEWGRTGQLMSKTGSGSTPLGGKEVYVSDGIKFLRSQNIWNDGLRLDSVARITPEIHSTMSGTSVQPMDILFNITGASIGRCALVPDDFDTANVSQHVAILRPIASETRHFLHKILISNYVQNAVMGAQVGVSREGLSVAKLSQFVVPLPPLAEQQRIVAKVDELMSLCDRLRAQLAEARSLQEHLAAALTEQAIAA